MAIAAGDILDGRFEVGRPAGSGGMGVVHRGVDRDSGAPVAIKTVRGAGGAERFQREVEILAALRHPGIVTYLGHGRVGDELYLVMEWLEGADLGERLADAELSMGEAISVAVQVAGALGAAHKLGIVHRDIKPSNVFLVDGRTDRVVLLDYGVARRASMEALTVTGAVVGTPSYMAPEQARGGRDIDARADVYALGALLFRCLAGRPPFEGQTIEEVIAAILRRPPPRLGELIPVSRDLETLVARMLHKNPAQRPADGEAACAALVAIDATTVGPTASVRPPSSALPTVRITPLSAGHTFTGEGAAGRADPEHPTDSRTGAPVSSVGVLSFLDMSPARDQDYLCDGIAEELINTLSQLDGLRVASRSSSFQFKSEAADARAIGARLGVDAVVEGGVRKAGDRLRITVRLVDVADGYQRWSHRFDGHIEDVFAIQDQIAASLATALRGMLSTRERDALRRPGTTPDAYEHFLRGRQLYHTGTSRAFAEAERYYRRAIEIDPSYAPAYAGLAQVHAWAVEWMGAGEEVTEAADRASRQALELGPDLSEAHVARGAVLAMRRDYDGASRAYAQAIALNSGSFEAHYLYARTCFQQGRFEESVALFRRAADLRVEDVQATLLIEMPLKRLGRLEEARAGRREGIRRAERRLELDPHDTRALSLGAVALVEEGEVGRALEWAQRALASGPDETIVLANVACMYARAGEKEEALSCLEKMFGRGIGKRDWIDNDPDYDPLRDDPRFQAMLARLS
jgi:serine/threonine protein kinase/tetratricopeptide (TPR) repeat protein